MPLIPDAPGTPGGPIPATGRGFAGFAVRRLLAALPVVGLVLLLSFALMRAVPGGPFDGSRALTPAVRANLERRYGLDRPLPEQVLRYVTSLAQGDLGDSLAQRDRSVAELLAAGAPLSLALGACALLLTLAGGVALGALAALDEGGVGDRLVRALTAMGLALPTYVLAPALILVVALRLHWLPVGGWEAGRPGDAVLPIIAIAWLPLFEVARLARGSVASALAAPYVEAARARGVGRRALLLHYVLGPALRPVLSYLAPLAAGVLAGSLLVERLFGLPGMGGYLIDGALARDYPLVLGATLVYLLLLVLVNLLVELLLGLLDPRLRRGWRTG